MEPNDRVRMFGLAPLPCQNNEHGLITTAIEASGEKCQACKRADNERGGNPQTVPWEETWQWVNRQRVEVYRHTLGIEEIHSLVAVLEGIKQVDAESFQI